MPDEDVTMDTRSRIESQSIAAPLTVGHCGLVVARFMLAPHTALWSGLSTFAVRGRESA